MNKYLKARLVLIVCLCLCLSFLAANLANAEVTVDGPTINDGTGGDWRDTYGGCFYLIPDPKIIHNTNPGEVGVGPDLYSVNADLPTDQYTANNCFGGELFDAGVIDWRIYRDDGIADTSVLAWSSQQGCEINEHARQYNPCLSELDNPVFKGAAWWDGNANKPVVVELQINPTGDSIELAYYFTNGNGDCFGGECRTQDWELWIDGQTEPIKKGTIGNFSNGKYVVFEIGGLQGLTTITFKSFGSINGDECSGSGLNNLTGNGILSGVFINCPEEELARIGDFVWCDADKDGLQNDGPESGIEGVEVTITCNGGFTEVTHTDATGHYGVDVPANVACSVEVGASPDPDGCTLNGTCEDVVAVDPLGPGEEDLNADFCFTPPDEECSECDKKVTGRVTELNLKYNGEEDAVIKVEQKDGKRFVQIFEGSVPMGERFTVYGQDSKGTLGTEIILFVDGTENTRIHTSCSKPIGPGLISGDFEVIEGRLENGDLICEIMPPDDQCSECKGKVTQLTFRYDGAAAADIVVTQKGGKDEPDIVVPAPPTVNPGDVFTINGQKSDGTFGNEIKILTNGTETKIHTSCSQDIGPNITFGDYKVLEGFSKDGGLICPFDVPPVDPPVDPPDDGCSECEGKVSELTLLYNGSATHTIRVDQKDGKHFVTIFNELVPMGGQFTVNGQDSKGTLGNEIKIFVNDIENTKIHTSCSKCIGPGMLFGLFEVLEGYSSKDGNRNLLCEGGDAGCKSQ